VREISREKKFEESVLVDAVPGSAPRRSAPVLQDGFVELP
jgi:hypothetical protein